MQFLSKASQAVFDQSFLPTAASYYSSSYLEDTILDVESKHWQHRVVNNSNELIRMSGVDTSDRSSDTSVASPTSETAHSLRRQRPTPSKCSTTHLLPILCLGDVGWSSTSEDGCFPVYCWVHPKSTAEGSNRATEVLAKYLRAQYETWKGTLLGKELLNPTTEDCRDALRAIRREASGSDPVPATNRILVHYCGHGTKKADGGNMYFLSRSSQPTPMAFEDLRRAAGTPSLFILDCDNAGSLLRLTPPSDRPIDRIDTGDIVFAACSDGEVLPQIIYYPTDIFTACMTTPNQIAILWHTVRMMPLIDAPLQIAHYLPGNISDKRTPLGELNWILVTITDTIAWTMMSPDLFFRFFRTDPVLATLCRSYLLACRIMRSFGCHCLVYPHGVIPDCSDHSLWNTWDLYLDTVVHTLVVHATPALPPLRAIRRELRMVRLSILRSRYPGPEPLLVPSSTFFKDSLNACAVWLQQAQATSNTPEKIVYLPLLLQTMLVPDYRGDTMPLLCRVADLGPWTIDQMFQLILNGFLLKLLTSKPNMALAPFISFIWVKFIAFELDYVVEEAQRGRWSLEFYLKPLEAPPVEATRALGSYSTEEGQLTVMCASLVLLSLRKAGGNSEYWKNVRRHCAASLQRNGNMGFTARRFHYLCIGSTFINSGSGTSLAEEDLCLLALLKGLEDSQEECRVAALASLRLMLMFLSTHAPSTDDPAVVHVVETVFPCLCDHVKTEGSSHARFQLAHLLVLYITLRPGVYRGKNVEAMLGPLLIPNPFGAGIGRIGSPLSGGDTPTPLIFNSPLDEIAPHYSDLRLRRASKSHVSERGEESSTPNSSFAAVGQQQAGGGTPDASMKVLECMIWFTKDPSEKVRLVASKVTQLFLHRVLNRPSSSNVGLMQGGVMVPQSPLPVGGGAISFEKRLTDMWERIRHAPKVQTPIGPAVVHSLSKVDLGVDGGFLPESSHTSMPFTCMSPSSAPANAHLQPLDVGVSWNLEDREMIETLFEAPTMSLIRSQLLQDTSRSMEETIVHQHHETELDRCCRAHWRDCHTLLDSEVACVKFVSTPAVTFLLPHPADLLHFHPYQPWFLAAGGSDAVSVLNWSDSTVRNTFRAAALPDAQRVRITNVHFIDAAYDSLVLVSTNTGVVSLFYKVCYSGQPTLAATFRGIPQGDVAGFSHDGFVTAWHQQAGYLHCSSTGTSVHVWDLQHQICVAECAANEDNESKTMCLATSPLSPTTVSTGCANGKVYVYDVRAKRPSHALASLEGGSCLTLHVPCYEGNTLYSVSAQSVVRQWDMRKASSGCAVSTFALSTISTKKPRYTENFFLSVDMHRYTSTILTSMNRGEVKLFSKSGRKLDKLKLQEPKPKSTVWHPNQPLFGVSVSSANDTTNRVSVYGLMDAAMQDILELW